jgi:ElaB/YqjD/DUF883 family membrane-anchored ribosome-binding protein
MSNRIHSAEETVEEDVKGLLHTRQALTDKLQLLERRVEENVVETKNAARDIIDHVKHTATDLLDTTIHRINPRRSWMMVGIPVTIGLLAGWMKRRRSGGVYAYYPPKAHGAEIMPEDRPARRREGVYPFYKENVRRDQSTGSRQEEKKGSVLEPVSLLWKDITEEFGKEGERLQKAAVMTGRSFAHDLVRIAVRILINAFDQALPPPRKTVHRQDSDNDTGQSRAA